MLQSLNTQMESLSARMRAGVAVSFEPIPDEQGPGLLDDMLRLPPSLHRTILVRSHVKGVFNGNWVCTIRYRCCTDTVSYLIVMQPIPESFWPSGLSVLPPRSAHPVIMYSRREVLGRILTTIIAI